jgi:hypothetical protein
MTDTGVDDVIRFAGAEVSSGTEELGTDNAFKSVCYMLGIN